MDVGRIFELLTEFELLVSVDVLLQWAWGRSFEL